MVFGKESEFHRSIFFSFLNVNIYMQFHIDVEDAMNNMDFRGQPGSRFCWCQSWEGCHCTRCDEILAWCPAESGSLFNPPRQSVGTPEFLSQGMAGVGRDLWRSPGPTPAPKGWPPSRVPSPRSRQLWDTPKEPPKLWGCCPWLVVLILQLPSTSQTPDPSP